MAGLALGLLAFYFVLAFGVRMLVQRVRTGSVGVNLPSPAGSRAWWIEVVFAAAAASALGGPLLQMMGWIQPFAFAVGPWVQRAGLGLAGAGVAATFGCQIAMGRSWRIGVEAGERTELVTSGPFAVVRNPIYSAMIATYLGLLLMVPNAAMTATAIALVAALQGQTRLVEEPHLVRVHGEAYRVYAARVGRFWPGLGRLDS